MSRYCRYCKYGIDTNNSINYACENKKLVDLYNENNKTKEIVVDEKTSKEYFPKGCPLYEHK